MRVLLVSDQYAPMVGGVPTVTRTLARGLAGRGHAVTLLVPRPGRGGPAAVEHQVSIDYRRSLPWPWYDGMRVAWVSRAAARELMTAFAPDVAHIHSPLTLGATARAAARQLGIPAIYTNHYLPENVRHSRGQRSAVLDAAFYSYLLRFSNHCSHVTAPTSTALRLLRDQGLRVPSGVISNGVDLGTYRPGPADQEIRDRYGLAADRPVILSVGRLSREKGVDVLLEAAVRLTQDAQVAVAGSGPDEARLRSRAGRLGLAGRVRFLGYVPGPDLPAVYRLADVFAIPSAAELQSLTTMEAMATGLPIVAADAYSLSELVYHGSNGLLVTPGRADELAGSLDALLADPALRATMADESLRIIAAHEQGRSFAEWESLYGLVASEARR
jgi:glycosyltransferase involved in cell wall biosynthesis